MLAAGWLPGDGYLEPEPLAAALAAGRRARTASTFAHRRPRHRRRASTAAGCAASITDRGTIATEVVVNAAGAAAGHVGRLAGVDDPDRADPAPVRRHRAARPAGRAWTLPTVRDPDHIVYFRPEAGGLLVGGYSARPGRRGTSTTRCATPRTLFEPDLERFAESWAAARRRVPALRGAEIARVVHGPEAFTPDGEFLLGETPRSPGSGSPPGSACTGSPRPAASAR